MKKADEETTEEEPVVDEPTEEEKVEETEEVPSTNATTPKRPVRKFIRWSKKPEGELTLRNQGKAILAKGKMLEVGFTVRKESRASLKEAATISPEMSSKRKQLISESVLKRQDDWLVFQKDYTFTTLNHATGVVLGMRATGWTAWRDENDVTLDEIMRVDAASVM